MTIKLARIAERDGLVFLCDKEGKDLSHVCLVPRRSIEWMSQSPSTAQQQINRWAAEVDISAALVKVPKMYGLYNHNAETEYAKGWNACLDELEWK